MTSLHYLGQATSACLHTFSKNCSDMSHGVMYFQVIGEAESIILKYGKCGSKNDAKYTCQKMGELESYHYIAWFPYGSFYSTDCLVFIQWIFYATWATPCEIATLYQPMWIFPYRWIYACTRLTHMHTAGGLEEWITDCWAAAKLRWIPMTAVVDRDIYTFCRGFCGSLLNIYCNKSGPKTFFICQLSKSACSLFD